jgi:hypothetical protein
MEQQLAGDGQVTVMQAVPAGAGGQQVQVSKRDSVLIQFSTTSVPNNHFNIVFLLLSQYSMTSSKSFMN